MGWSYFSDNEKDTICVQSDVLFEKYIISFKILISLSDFVQYLSEANIELPFLESLIK